MIELRRPADSADADAIAATLADMVVAHRIVVEDDLTAPVLVDGERLATGDEVAVFLSDLAADLADWNRFQADACYIGDDGRIC